MLPLNLFQIVDIHNFSFLLIISFSSYFELELLFHSLIDLSNCWKWRTWNGWRWLCFGRWHQRCRSGVFIEASLFVNTVLQINIQYIRIPVQIKICRTIVPALYRILVASIFSLLVPMQIHHQVGCNWDSKMLRLIQLSYEVYDFPSFCCYSIPGLMMEETKKALI